MALKLWLFVPRYVLSYSGLKSLNVAYKTTIHDLIFGHFVLVSLSGVIVLRLRSLFILVEPLMTLSTNEMQKGLR